MSFELDRGLLLELFRISSPSNKEEKMREFIKGYLSMKLINFEEDTTGNIFKMDIKNAPLLSCHMDTVESGADSPLTKFINIYKHGEREYLRGYGVIGGDDKCGIFLILSFVVKYQLNFIFSVGEETGCKGISAFMPSHKPEFKDIPYALILDRRGNTDIICEDNDYGTLKFQAVLDKVGEKFNYKHARGFSSDANHIRNEVSCANLSVGYYNPHNKNEFVDLNDLQNVYNFVLEIITTIKDRFDPKESRTTYGYQGGTYQGYQGGPYISCFVCYKQNHAVKKMLLLKSIAKNVCEDCAKKLVNEVLDNNELWNLADIVTPTKTEETKVIETKVEINKKELPEPVMPYQDFDYDICY